ncbi:hypothetical protein ZWY2020_001125 [Hordeum vulgare]|nr:hypothetical protein ZWY2020_001125 [Hordeum vulgare]
MEPRLPEPSGTHARLARASAGLRTRCITHRCSERDENDRARACMVPRGFMVSSSSSQALARERIGNLATASGKGWPLLQRAKGAPEKDTAGRGERKAAARAAQAAGFKKRPREQGRERRRSTWARRERARDPPRARRPRCLSAPERGHDAVTGMVSASAFILALGPLAWGSNFFFLLCANIHRPSTCGTVPGWIQIKPGAGRPDRPVRLLLCGETGL